MDATVAAIADVHGLTLVARNVADFVRLGIPCSIPGNRRDREPSAATDPASGPVAAPGPSCMAAIAP
jgi:hypothetical protein